MQTVNIIGDADSCLAIPTRLSKTADVREGEKLWATLAVDDLARFTDWFDATFGECRSGDGTYRKSAQVAISRIKSELEHGVMADREFTLTIYDWMVQGAVTTLSRSVRPS